jgi:hypothetical protein
MSHGFIAEEFIEPIKKVVNDKVVLDIGAGDLDLARLVVRFGASKVIAIDKELFHERNRSKRIEIARMYFSDYWSGLDIRKPVPWVVGLLSWPVNWTTDGLLPLVSSSKQLIVLSKNSDGSACGTPALWRHLSRRVLLECIPNRKNWLTIYGNEIGPHRIPTGEEMAGCDLDVQYTYEQTATKKGKR